MPKKKTSITMRIDPDVLAWYKAHSESYQLTIQEVLQRHMTRTTNPMPGDLSMPAATKPPKKTKDPKPEKGQVFRSTEEYWQSLTGFEDVSDADLAKQLDDALQGSRGLDDLKPSPGARFTEHKDARTGTIRLESCRQPLYDTQVHGTMFNVPMGRRDEYIANPPPIVFFQTGGGPNRGPAITNLATSGQLTWPKRFDLDGVRISFSHLVDISEAHFELQIGEKRYLTMPLKNMERDDDPIKDGEYGPLLPRMRLKHVGITPTIYIPPVQWFGLTINTGGKHFESAEIRVQLDGTIHREIQ
jgi:hypothetical protein